MFRPFFTFTWCSASIASAHPFYTMTSSCFFSRNSHIFFESIKRHFPAIRAFDGNFGCGASARYEVSGVLVKARCVGGRRCWYWRWGGYGGRRLRRMRGMRCSVCHGGYAR
ncbi:hypothetical protein DEU56DRAFT_471497 [Suillus clintonianus]|uniref:uncharacterized protein n=1 Tax=Suillus clintonianus TaxID=1904413 RepID=UPI001B879CF0|nr:uncharacterized protein DEU56DRAFT_471497 [Suillus clintonianus]KAG2153182.1 hypothetical protein DEU56DRAFT_471497 [Suillus clintonianus]